MKVIFIYGPPAVGKLSVAKELQKLTGYRLFHNHLVNDVLGAVMKFGRKGFWEEGNVLKAALIGVAAKYKSKGLIFTMVYVNKKESFSLVRKVKAVMRRYKGEVNFVRLDCDETELLKRVKGESRKEFKKIKSVSELKKFFKEFGAVHRIHSKNQLIVDNTKKSPKKVAEEIVKYFKLRKK